VGFAIVCFEFPMVEWFSKSTRRQLKLPPPRKVSGFVNCIDETMGHRIALWKRGVLLEFG
jgi:hypothetical protein